MDAYNVYVTRRELYLLRLLIEDFSGDKVFYNYSKIVYSAIVRDNPAMPESCVWQQALNKISNFRHSEPYTSREILTNLIIDKLEHYSDLIGKNIHIEPFQTSGIEETGLAQRIY